jgi:hypothetical protein
VVAGRVALARQRMAFRLRGTRWRLNAEIPGRELRRRYAPAPGALAPLERAMDLGEISARRVDRVIRLSWTVADLGGVARPTVAGSAMRSACGWGWPSERARGARRRLDGGASDAAASDEGPWGGRNALTPRLEADR